MIITTKQKIKLLYADDEQASKADELPNRKLILISGFMSAIEYLAKALQRIMFANRLGQRDQDRNTYWSQDQTEVKQ